MHDVHRDSLIAGGKKRKVEKSGHDDHESPHGHNHDHEEDAYEEHDQDLHTHEHDHGHKHGGIEDRAFAHLHEHGHDFFHAHHHTHHPEHTGVVHKIFNDPVRDWFGAALMGILIVVGYLKWLPGHLSDGMVVCAAVMGIFPLLKNALFSAFAKRELRFELVLGILLLGGLLWGEFIKVALISLVLVLGSFLRLNFSWKD